MAAPVDPGDFLNAPALSTPVAAPYKADADLYDARFLVLYRYLDKTIVGVDAAAIQDGIITRALVEAQPAWSTVALTGATWAPVNLSYYKDSLGIVRFRPEAMTASANFAVGQAFGTMPVGTRPLQTLYFPCNRLQAGSAGSMHFSLDADGTLRAGANFTPATQAIGFTTVEYRAEQ